MSDFLALCESVLWCLLKIILVLTLLISPFAVEWVLDGCPAPEKQTEILIEDVKGGWQ